MTQGLEAVGEVVVAAPVQLDLTRTRAETVAFDVLLTGDLPADQVVVGVAQLELGILETKLVRFAGAQLMEVVHVELAHERGETGMSEVHWQNAVLEVLKVVD